MGVGRELKQKGCIAFEVVPDCSAYWSDEMAFLTHVPPLMGPPPFFPPLSWLQCVAVGCGSLCQAAVFPGSVCQGCLLPAVHPQSV